MYRTLYLASTVSATPSPWSGTIMEFQGEMFCVHQNQRHSSQCEWKGHDFPTELKWDIRE